MVTDVVPLESGPAVKSSQFSIHFVSVSCHRTVFVLDVSDIRPAEAVLVLETERVTFAHFEIYGTPRKEIHTNADNADR